MTQEILVLIFILSLFVLFGYDIYDKKFSTRQVMSDDDMIRRFTVRRIVFRQYFNKKLDNL